MCAMTHSNAAQCNVRHNATYVTPFNTLQHTPCCQRRQRSKAWDTTTHCNTHPGGSFEYCNTTPCTTLHHTAPLCTTLHYSAIRKRRRQRNLLHCTATHCNTLQHTATHCNTLQHMFRVPHSTAPHCTALYCTALQHTATHATRTHPPAEAPAH